MREKRLALLKLIILVLFISGCSKNKTEFESIKPIYNTTEIEQITEISTFDNHNNNDDIKIDLKYETDFKGITISNEALKPINPAFSNSYLKLQSYTTYDKETDTLFYVNYGTDDYLYSFKDDRNELLIKMPVNFPVYYDGDIFSFK